MALTDGIKNKLNAIADAIRGKTNKTEELTLEQMASEVSGIYSPKAEEVRKVTIDENGTIVVTPSEGSDVMKSVEINAMINAGLGFDLTSIGYSPTKSQEWNDRYYNAVNIARDIYLNWDKNIISLNNKFLNNKDLIFMPLVDTSSVVYMHQCFRSSNLELIQQLDYSSVENIGYAFSNCYYLRGNLNINSINCTSFGYCFNYAINLESIKINTDKCNSSCNGFFQYCYGLKTLEMTSIEGLTSATNMFSQCSRLVDLKFTRWKKVSISLSNSSNLSSESIKYIIWHALNGENNLGFENQGATSRILTLHATPYNSWETWKTTKPSVEDCEYLGISEEEIDNFLSVMNNLIIIF